MDETFVIRIEVIKDRYVYVSPDPRMPCILADKIKETVENFYRERPEA